MQAPWEQPELQRPSKHCHKMVADTAKALTHELYDELMKDRVLCAQWRTRCGDMTEARREQKFVNMYWAQAIPVARATLAHMLEGTLEESLKTSIYDALVLDATLLRGRGHSVEGPAPHGPGE